MKAYVLMHVRVGSIPEVVKNLQRTEGVEEAHMTFGPFDVVAEIQAGDARSLGSMLAAHIHPIPGIIDTTTLLVVD
jgi:DNA-binding Lrp family transcriptional regulator